MIAPQDRLWYNDTGNSREGMSSMKDFINRHGHLSMCVIIILLVIAFFMSRNFLLWSTYQKTMDAFVEFSEQENNNIFITAQVDMVKIVTKTAEIDINDYPELYEMLCDAEFAEKFVLPVKSDNKIGGYRRRNLLFVFLFERFKITCFIYHIHK